MIKITENPETAPEDAEEISVASNSIRDFNETASDLHLESIMHSSMQSLVMKGSVHSMESGSMITIALIDEKTIQVVQKGQDDQTDQKDQADHSDQEEQGNQEDQGDQVDHGNQKDQKKAKMPKHEYVHLCHFIDFPLPFSFGIT